MTIEKVLNKKAINDVSNQNTYMIRKVDKDGWLKDELTIVKSCSSSGVVIFRCKDGKEHTVDEDKLTLFKLL